MITEQEHFTNLILEASPHVEDVDDLSSKVKLSLEISGLIRVYIVYSQHSFLLFQFDREISQTRSKSKEKLFSNISTLFPGVIPEASGNSSTKELKTSRQAALKPLAGPEGTQNPPFLYVPPKWDLDENGNFKHKPNREKIMLEPPRSLFYSLCIITAFHQLWYGNHLRWGGP